MKSSAEMLDFEKYIDSSFYDVNSKILPSYTMHKLTGGG